MLYGLSDCEECAVRLGKDVDIAALKTGKDGSLAVSRRSLDHVPGRPITAIDSTGAGDMFAAGFLAGLSWNHEPPEAARMGGHLAEEVIMQTGAQLTVERIRALKNQLTGATS